MEEIPLLIFLFILYGMEVGLLTAVNYISSYFDNYSLGSSLNTSTMPYVVYNAINAGNIPDNSNNGLYFVLSSADVTGNINSYF